ncbi:hypothetical protein BV20DRAFT_974944 [Pilatotrama ljubarskyi]|nr:hypothetical protein BV20DRAFT_974944 [Pilatotrama ljubarskyi]
MHQHLTWCSGKDKGLSMQMNVKEFVRAQLADYPNPTFFTMREWAATLGVTFYQVAKTIEQCYHSTLSTVTPGNLVGTGYPDQLAPAERAMGLNGAVHGAVDLPWDIAQAAEPTEGRAPYYIPGAHLSEVPFECGSALFEWHGGRVDGDGFGVPPLAGDGPQYLDDFVAFAPPLQED